MVRDEAANIRGLLFDGHRDVPRPTAKIVVQSLGLGRFIVRPLLEQCKFRVQCPESVPVRAWGWSGENAGERRASSARLRDQAKAIRRAAGRFGSALRNARWQASSGRAQRAERPTMRPSTVGTGVSDREPPNCEIFSKKLKATTRSSNAAATALHSFGPRCERRFVSVRTGLECEDQTRHSR
jgi:hypothetical protein